MHSSEGVDRDWSCAVAVAASGQRARPAHDHRRWRQYVRKDSTEVTVAGRNGRRCTRRIRGSAASASAEVVYSNIPNTLSGNYASIGPEAYAYHEFGGQVELTGTARNKPTVEVVMSTWGCQYGSWNIKGTPKRPSRRRSSNGR